MKFKGKIPPLSLLPIYVRKLDLALRATLDSYYTKLIKADFCLLLLKIVCLKIGTVNSLTAAFERFG